MAWLQRDTDEVIGTEKIKEPSAFVCEILRPRQEHIEAVMNYSTQTQLQKEKGRRTSGIGL